jgi:hypothetical protein
MRFIFLLVILVSFEAVASNSCLVDSATGRKRPANTAIGYNQSGDTSCGDKCAPGLKPFNVGPAPSYSKINGNGFLCWREAGNESTDCGTKSSTSVTNGSTHYIFKRKAVKVGNVCRKFGCGDTCP